MSSLDNIFKSKYITMLNLPITIQSSLNDTIIKIPLHINNLYVQDTLYGSNNIFFGNNLINTQLLNTNNCLTNNLNTYANIQSYSLLSKESTAETITINNGLANNLSVTNAFSSNMTSIYTYNVGNINVSLNTIINNCTTLTIINTGNTNIKTSVIVYSNFYVTNNSSINNNITVLGNLNSNVLYSNNCICNNNLNNMNTSLIINNLTLLANLKIQKNCNINTTSVSNNISILNSLYVSGLATIKQLTSKNIVLSGLQDLPDNISAVNANIPLWGFYRTGGVLKVRLDTIPPTLQLSGGLVNIIETQSYIEPGVLVSDTLESVTPYISAIYFSSYNYLSNPITFTISSMITNFNSLLIGNHTIMYSVLDSFNNLATKNRLVIVSKNTTKPIVSINGDNPYKISLGSPYIEYGVSVISPITRTSTLNINSNVNTSILGKYSIEYKITDYNNIESTPEYRTVYVLNTESFQFVDLSNYGNALNYLYITGNYNMLNTSQYWTFEAWIYLTSYNNGCIVVDFEQKPFVSNTGKFKIIISATGIPGILFGFESYPYNPTSIIQLNKWTHVVWQRNGVFVEFYINGSYIGYIFARTYFDNMLNFNQLTLGMRNDLTPDNSLKHFIGKISHAKLSYNIQYTVPFIPPNNLLNITSDVLFCLGNNYTDLVSNKQMSYFRDPIIDTRESYIRLPSTGIETKNLLFNMLVSDLPTINIPWVASNTNNFRFILHSNANNFPGISKTQNGNGWKRSANAAWILDSSSYSLLQSQNWHYGITLEQWIFIDYNFIPPTTNYLISGQELYYGFTLSPSSFNYSSWYGNMLGYMIGSLVVKDSNNFSGGLNIFYLRGKWTHLAITIGTTYNTLQLYINGGLVLNKPLTSIISGINLNTEFNFNIGCNNNGIIPHEILSTIHYGNTRLYNRVLSQDEIINNYSYELNNYIIPSIDLIIQPIINTVPKLYSDTYDTTNGILLQPIDLNIIMKLSQWCFEVWVYPTSWGDSSHKRIFDLSSGTNTIYLGITNNVSNITPSISNDNLGRPCVFNNNMGGSGVLLINNTQQISLNQWSHIVYQKNTSDKFEMFVNGKSTGIFTLVSVWWENSIFQSGLNTLVIGGDKTQPNSVINHWLGKISQPKINLYRKYTGNFTPVFDLSLNDNGIFLLQDNFINTATSKSMTSNSVIITPYTKPIMTLVTGATKILQNTVWSDPGITINYYNRANFPINIIGTVNTSIIDKYNITYSILDNYNNISYIQKQISVVKTLNPPIINLIGGLTYPLIINTDFNEPGYTITSDSNEIIIPEISGIVNTSQIGNYNITYTATDSYDNTNSVIRVVQVVSFILTADAFFWIDPSDLSTITLNIVNNSITRILDKRNNINMIPLDQNNRPRLVSNMGNWMNRPVMAVSSGGLISSIPFLNSLDITIGMVFWVESSMSTLIWGHYSTTNDIRLEQSNPNNILLSCGGSSARFRRNDTPDLFIGTIRNGIFKKGKLINLRFNSIEIIENNTFTTLPTTTECPIYVGNTGSLCTIGEIIYWKKVISDNQLIELESYLYNKWRYR